MSQEWGLVRIDDRLIHGQVIAVWCKHRPFTRIVIVGGAVAADPFMREVMRLAAPRPAGGCPVAGRGGPPSAAGLPPRETTMLLMRSPQAALRLYEGSPIYGAERGRDGNRPGPSAALPPHRRLGRRDCRPEGPGRAGSGDHVSDGAWREGPVVQGPSRPLSAFPENHEGHEGFHEGHKGSTLCCSPCFHLHRWQRLNPGIPSCPLCTLCDLCGRY